MDIIIKRLKKLPEACKCAKANKYEAIAIVERRKKELKYQIRKLRKTVKRDQGGST